MDTEDGYRQRTLRLINEMHVTQKSIAHAMGVKPSWLSRWLNKSEGRSITVPQAQRLEEHMAKLAQVAKETQRAANEPTTAGGDFRQHGT